MVTVLSRRAVIGLLAAGGGLLGLGAAVGYLRRSARIEGQAGAADRAVSGGASGQRSAGSMMAGTGMMGAATAADMSAYQDLFARHTQLHRRVELVPGGVRTVTEADAPDLVARLQAHVADMYAHLDQGTEVWCMSGSLPTLFQGAASYRRVSLSA